MSDQETVDKTRRNLLIATSVMGTAGGITATIPFLSAFAPSERAKAAGAPVKVDIASIKVGEMQTVEWRGKPVWIVRRSPEMLTSLTSQEQELADPTSKRKPSELTPSYARNRQRSIKPEYLVVVGICSHLGCSPTAKFQPGAAPSLPSNWKGGFLCPCHGSTFDMAGRVYKNKPAPDNLEVPPHMYLSDLQLLIGEDKRVNVAQLNAAKLST